MMPEYRPGMTLADLPIPRDVRPTAKWPTQLIELAEVIGANGALRIVEHAGGQKVWVSKDSERSPFRGVLTAREAKVIAQVYGGTELELPVARAALNEARRGPVLASVRNKDITVAEAARILGTARAYVAQLAHRSGEAADTEPLRRPKRGDDRQIEMFGRPD